MTLAEKLAQKRAAAQPAPPADDLPKNGLKLTGSPPKPPAEPPGLAGTRMVEGRQLGYQEGGEHVPLKHEADGLDPKWSKLAHSFTTDLCIVIGPGCEDACWLAIWTEESTFPLLIHKLPLRIMPDAYIPF